MVTHALTLHRPWPALILHAGEAAKTVENRSWPPPPRLGRIALHAGRTLDRALLAELEERIGHPMRELTDQGLVGTVRVMGAHSAARCPGGPACRDWATDDTGWHWMLASPWPLPRPVAARGRQKLWELSPEQQQAVAALTVATRL